MVRLSRRAPARVQPHRENRSERLIRMLLAACGSPAGLLELYYWSREPGMIDIVRAIAAMPEQTRASFEAFVALAGDSRSIEATLEPHGALTLASPEASKAIALASYAAENESEDSARRLN
jgi:hypothetical protein